MSYLARLRHCTFQQQSHPCPLKSATIKQADAKHLIASALKLYPAIQEIKLDAYGTTTIPQSARLPAGLESLLRTLPFLSTQVVTTLQAVLPVATYSTVQVLQVPPTIALASEIETFFTTSSLYKSEIKPALVLSIITDRTNLRSI